MQKTRSYKAIASIGAVGLVALLGTSTAQAQNTVIGQSGKSVINSAKKVQRRSLSAADRANAKSRMPRIIVKRKAGQQSATYGQQINHPFTTKGAYSSNPQGLPVNLNPWRATGKLWIQYGTSLFVCTASVIDKGLLVTAAHCIQNFGQGGAGSPDFVWFQPARHGSTLHRGQWDAVDWVVPTTYSNGTDVCSPSAPGVVCENDLAIVIMAQGTGPYAGKDIAQVTNRYQYYDKNAGYTSFLGKQAGHITQLGYPQAFEGGEKMIRTDSMGYQDPYNQVIIGSAQTGGSSGGPWIMNFGLTPSATVTPEVSANLSNRVVGTASWGLFYQDGTPLGQMGASRFNNNTAYPAPGATNIATLIADACAAYASKCY